MRINFKGKNKFTIIQTTVIVFIWILLLAVPVLFGNFPESRKWVQIFRIWKEYAFLFALFLINRFVLLPFLFFHGKRIAYFISAGTLIVVLFLVIYIKFMNQPARLPEKIPPVNEIMRPPIEQVHPMPGLNRREPLIPPYANLLILSFLILGFDTGLSISIKWIQSEQSRIKLEKENTENKLAFLQNQVSPHFFMNTLNNIHALVDIDTEEAKGSIIKLSRLMDYMLYESQTSTVPLKQEIDFIRSYVELMKLRFTDDIDIVLDIPPVLPAIKTPPLLTISFIENAFKYGVSYESPSFIHIFINVDETGFSFRVRNSLHPEKVKRENSGIGIRNARNRLELLYGQNYELSINNENNTFEVNMNIPV